MAKFTEEDILMRRIGHRFNQGVVKYRLIDDDDKILVGLSGGKDSLALLELLAKRSRILKPRFSVVAVHVSMSNIPYQADLEYLRSYAEGLGVKFIHYETCFDPSTDTRKSPCFLCSWNRRKALFTVAKEEGCNKIALGHHMDDILETLLMNITFQGAFSTMPPRLVMKKFFPVSVAEEFVINAAQPSMSPSILRQKTASAILAVMPSLSVRTMHRKLLKSALLRR